MGKQKWTKESIRRMLASDDRWLVRGLLAIYKLQTMDERAQQSTKHWNGVGFNKHDAGFLSSLAESFKKYDRLTPKQVKACRKAMLKYAGQLAKIANGEVGDAS